MRKNLHYKVLASVLAISTLNYALPADAEAYTNGDPVITDSGYTVTDAIDTDYIFPTEDTQYDGYIQYDYGNTLGTASPVTVIIDNSTVTLDIIGKLGNSEGRDANGNRVYIINGSNVGDVTGGEAIQGSAHSNIVVIENSTVRPGSQVSGGSATQGADYNTIKLVGNSILKDVDLYGWEGSIGYGHYNTLTLDNWSGEVNSINRFRYINFENIDITKGSTLAVTGTTDFSGDITIKSITVNKNTLAGDYAQGEVILSNISWSSSLGTNVNVNNVNVNIVNDDNIVVQTTLDNIPLDDYYTDDNANNGIFVNKFNALGCEIDNNDNHKVNFTADVDKSILTGKFIDEDGIQCNSNQTADTASLTIGEGFETNVGTVAGVYAADGNNATGGKLIISGNTTYGKDLYGAYAENGNAENSTVEISGDTNYKGTVYAGYSEKGEVNNNTITVANGTNAENMSLSGSNKSTAAGTLNINGNGSVFNEISNFETINFIDTVANKNPALTVETAKLDGTAINLENLDGGQAFNEGDTLTLIAGNIEGTPTLIHDKVTAGLTQDLVVEETVNNNGIQLAVKDVSMNDQITLVAENRAVAAAFVNQGTDLISDSLDTLSRDGNYGVKTFAAVHGNRSKYDVNSDLKINGWSTIVGVGNAAEFADGDEFSWGVFYENGSGNYRTYNEFNNEFFRGDGSLVYNGGGIAARYENANGVYTEGSLRAGMLKSEMDNALRDGTDNYYGYDSESAYYGAHIGLGKIISLSDSSDLDVYGKFFHTYTEGDSFTVAKDKFEFDSITSDRLRIGARVTTNKANAFSTYYGLAYEYEFNGDADMRAQNLKAPTQSLQGSSYMAEVGFNYQPTPDSPWSFDLNMRGYAGERKGASFNVQATYTF